MMKIFDSWTDFYLFCKLHNIKADARPRTGLYVEDEDGFALLIGTYWERKGKIEVQLREETGGNNG